LKKVDYQYIHAKFTDTVRGGEAACIIDLFEKIAASLHHGRVAGLGHCIPREVSHHLRDVDHQRSDGGVGGFVNISLTEVHHAAKACSMIMSMGMQHEQCSMEMDLQHVHGHAAWTWTCSMGIDMDWLGIVALF
jgi:hypothetical protein